MPLVAREVVVELWPRLPATLHVPARFPFFSRMPPCHIAGASPLLFEVTFQKKYQDNYDEVAFDVNAVFSS